MHIRRNFPIGSDPFVYDVIPLCETQYFSVGIVLRTFDHVSEIIRVNDIAGNMETEKSDAGDSCVNLRPIQIRTPDCYGSVDSVAFQDGWTQIRKLCSVTLFPASIATARRTCEKRQC
jgi:hypothetical protein